MSKTIIVDGVELTAEQIEDAYQRLHVEPPVPTWKVGDILAESVHGILAGSAYIITGEPREDGQYPYTDLDRRPWGRTPPRYFGHAGHGSFDNYIRVRPDEVFKPLAR